MRDRLQIVEAFESLASGSQTAALATVVSVEGSAYRRPGARMLVASDGRTWGTISGGCLERDVARRARMLIGEPREPLVVCYETDAEDAGEENARPVVDPGPSLGCGGRIEILIQRVACDTPGAIDALAAVVRRRDKAVVATVIRAGSAPQVNVKPGGCVYRIGSREIGGGVEDPALLDAMMDHLRRLPERGETFQIHRHGLTAGGWAEVLIEWMNPAQSVAIFGDGHDVAPMAELCRTLGWHLKIIGSRSEATLRSLFPDADEVICEPDDPGRAVAELPEDTAAVVMGHNFRRDSAALAALLKQPRSYIGVLGPRRRTQRLLAAAGCAVDDDRIYSPVGLDIGAENPEQVALAIAAEIQSTSAGRPGGLLRTRLGPIHTVGAREEIACPGIERPRH